jgi:hypothetical protein
MFIPGLFQVKGTLVTQRDEREGGRGREREGGRSEKRARGRQGERKRCVKRKSLTRLLLI